MTDPAELAKLIEELRAFPKDLGERITSDATMRHICLKPMYDTGDLAEALARHICGKAAAMLDQLASTTPNYPEFPGSSSSTMSAEDVREAAAKIAESHATCGCGGKQGWCNEDGWPLAIAAAIRAMPLK